MWKNLQDFRNWSSCRLFKSRGFYITVGNTGVISLTDSEGIDSLTPQNVTVGLNNTVQVKDSPITVNLVKENSDGGAVYGSNITVTGVFTDSNGIETTKLFIDSTSTPKYSGIIKGVWIAGNTYTVQETVIPAGYTKISDFTFTVSDMNKITVTPAADFVKVKIIRL